MAAEPGRPSLKRLRRASSLGEWITYPEADNWSCEGSEGSISSSDLLWDGLCPNTSLPSAGGEGDWEG